MASLQPSHRNQPRVPNLVNDTYCVKCVTRLKDCACVSGQRGLNPSPVIAKDRDLTSKSETVNLLVNSCVANAHSVIGLPQKKGVIPNYCHNYTEIKYVKDFSCVCHLSSVNLVTNVPAVAIDLPVGARLHQFWKKWESLGVSPKVVTGLREGYTLPFRFRPNLTRSSTVISNYVNPHKKPQPFGGPVSTGEQKCSRTGRKPKLPGILQPALFGTQIQQLVEILDLSTLNTFLNTESFKMETPETIRTSLHAGEWVTSIDFQDAYFHIPIHSQSRKYIFTSRVGPTSLKHYPLVCPQHPWSSQW